MAKEEAIKLEGRIVESYPNATFDIELDNGQKVLGYVSGKLRLHSIRIIVGDRVEVEVSPYDLKRGRITYRLK